MNSKHRQSTHCARGHAFDAENSYAHPDGRRRCWTCRQLARHSGPRPDRAAAFWSKVQKTNSCWLWAAAIDVGGYGRWRGKRAHRVAYEVCRGPIPAGLQLDHLCRVRHCVNPDHLEPVTPKENYLRGVSPWANNARKTHCPRGHPFDAKNTFVRKSGRRGCRTCRNAEARAYYHKSKPRRSVSRREHEGPR